MFIFLETWNETGLSHTKLKFYTFERGVVFWFSLLVGIFFQCIRCLSQYKFLCLQWVNGIEQHKHKAQEVYLNMQLRTQISNASKKKEFFLNYGFIFMETCDKYVLRSPWKHKPLICISLCFQLKAQCFSCVSQSDCYTNTWDMWNTERLIKFIKSKRFDVIFFFPVISAGETLQSCLSSSATC